MKRLLHLGFALAICLPTQLAVAQATITGPSTWASGQPTTVTWTVQQASTCASGVRVMVNLSNTSIQTGNAVLLKAGQSSIPGITVPAGTAVNLTLKDMCTGKIVSAAHAVSITGGTAAITPVAAPAATAITAQVRANIDSACQGVLGSACSSSASYSSIYTAITQKITQGSLKSDSSSIMYNYLIPMVQSSPSWAANVVDTAWRATGCPGAAPESQYVPRIPQLQTYQAVVNAMRAQGCTASTANVAPAPAPSSQYLSAQQMSPAYNQVWGSAAARATIKLNCPVATGAVSCARSDLAAYVKGNGTAILQTVAATPYQSVIGQTLDATHVSTVIKAYGVNWSGADDLVTYLRANSSLFRAPAVTTTVLAGLDSKGCMVNSAGVKLSPNETCGMYFLDSKGGHATGIYPAHLMNGAMVILSAATSGGGVVVTNNGAPVKVVVTSTGWAIGNGIVAQGGGNIVAQGGGNIVAQGGGNIVAQGGGNIVAQGGGNIVAQGGGNLISNVAFMDPLSAARSSGLIDRTGTSIISQDGNGFLQSLYALPAFSSGAGNASSGVLGNTASANSLLTDNGAASITRTLSSVSSAPAAVITGPSTWTYGQPAMITWSPAAGAPACASGYKVLINGTTPVGNAVTLTLGKSLLQANSWPRGTVSVSLVNVCTGAPAAAPFTTRIQ